MTMAKASQAWGRAERDGIIQDLNRTRWSLAEAMENAGLADHMGSADPDWLKAMRHECVELRREIRINLDADGFAEYVARCSILHITKLEDLPEPVTN
jgi:hypothetical protein